MTKRTKALKGVFRAGTEKWNKIKKNQALLSLRAVLLTSRRKTFFSFILPMKRLHDTCLKNSLVVLQFSFFVSPQAKNGFWPDHPCEQRSKV